MTAANVALCTASPKCPFRVSPGAASARVSYALPDLANGLPVLALVPEVLLADPARHCPHGAARFGVFASVGVLCDQPELRPVGLADQGPAAVGLVLPAQVGRGRAT